MPIIDSRSNNSKFDAIIRTGKADALMSFIMASFNCDKHEGSLKTEVADRLISGYNLYRIGGSGTYGDGKRGIVDQFESHYTMGYEMGIWTDSYFSLNNLAIKVANYEITVREYIGIVFRNLFTYYLENDKQVYHHFLYEILSEIINRNLMFDNIPKDLISDTLPIIDKKVEQANIIFNYLIDTDIFIRIDKNTFKLREKWANNIKDILDSCNLEYKNVSYEDANELFKNKKFYSDYVTKVNKKSCCKNIKSNNKRLKGENILLYGVPGSGKSYTIKTKYCDDFRFMERVVFHPDYMNTDFIGQILPVVRGNGEDRIITYDFIPGPFTRILKKAFLDCENMYYLVIEEINRGNASAIFGEIFQLLDREVDGNSSFKITNDMIAKEVYGNENEPVYIPNNLTILGTMNTSDQNVFTLDTAFQRRWNMKMIKNDINNARHANVKILDTDITWKTFNTELNRIILDNSNTTLSSEDKRLGAYFVTEDVLSFDNIPTNSDLEIIKEDDESYGIKNIEKNNRFGEKVIKYLWDDVFKFNRSILFNDKYNGLEEVIDTFNNSVGNERFKIFVESVRESLLN